ncbi:type IV pilin [Haloferacaceae archaeon DSL9]
MFNELSTERRAVSPVIGVILMVAITVILAAVIGTFVLQMGGSLGQSAPQASISVSDHDWEGDEIELRHSGGDTIEWADTNIIVENSNDGEVRWEGPGEEGAFSPGDRVTIVTNEVATLGVTEASGDSNPFELESGDRITVTLIDRDSGEIFFESDFRV